MSRILQTLRFGSGASPEKCLEMGWGKVNLLRTRKGAMKHEAACKKFIKYEESLAHSRHCTPLWYSFLIFLRFCGC